MKKATTQQFNLQDQKLNEARKAGQVVTITLMDGTRFSGLVTAFDLFTIAFITPNPEMDLMIYKHAISFIRTPPTRPERATAAGLPTGSLPVPLITSSKELRAAAVRLSERR